MSTSCNNKNILIIKLASVGDVLRTTAILPGVKKKYTGSLVTWVVDSPGQDLLEGNTNIGRILVYGEKSALSLRREKFDIILSLDKDIKATSLAMLIEASEKYGYGLNKGGKVYPLNKETEYSYLLGIDNDLKFFKNKKTYQELIFDISKLEYKRNSYELILDKKHLEFAVNFFKKNNLDENDIIIGINTGAGRVFANKSLRKERISELIELLLKEEPGLKIMLLGGPLETEIHDYIRKTTRKSTLLKIMDSGCRNNLKDFCALINKCSVVVTADTLAMHIAIALKRPVVALFGPTCSQEIDLYDRGSKVITRAECGPCYKSKCDKAVTCMDKIDLNETIEAVKSCMAARVKM